MEEKKPEEKEETPPTPAPSTKPEKDAAEPEEEKGVEVPEEDWKISPLFYELASYLGVEEKDWEKSAEKMSIIVDWAVQEAKSNKIQDLLPVIRKLEDRIMRPAWGETRLANIYRYLRLAMKRDAFNKALSAYETKGGVTK